MIFFLKFAISFYKENIKSFLRTDYAKSLMPKIMRRAVPGTKLGNLYIQRIKR